MGAEGEAQRRTAFVHDRRGLIGLLPGGVGHIYEPGTCKAGETAVTAQWDCPFRAGTMGCISERGVCVCCRTPPAPAGVTGLARINHWTRLAMKKSLVLSQFRVFSPLFPHLGQPYFLDMRYICTM